MPQIEFLLIMTKESHISDEINIMKTGESTAKGFGHFIDHGQKLLKDVHTTIELHENSLLELEDTLELHRKCLSIAKQCVQEKMEGASKYLDFVFKMSEAESVLVNEYLMMFGIQVQKDYEKNECIIVTIPKTKKRVYEIFNIESNDNVDSRS